MSLSAEQRLTRAVVWLMGEPKYAAFSGLYMMGKVEVNDTVRTAGTNGRDEFYGRAFVESLTDEEVRGVKLHETWHKAGRHFMVWKHLADEDPKLANMAMDYVINLFIHDSDPKGTEVRLPKGILLDERFRNMDIGEVYKILKQENKNGQGNSAGQAGQNTPGDGGESGTLDEHDWDSASSLSAEEQDKLATEIDECLRQGAQVAGKLGAKMPRGLEEVLQPKVDWREQLRDFVGAFAAGADLPSYRKPNRRMMGGGLVLPSHVSETVGKLVIASDASGSTGGALEAAFLAEINAICEVVKPESVELLYWDTAVCQHETYDENSYAGLLTSTKPRGGGGTDPQCVVDYMKQRAIRAECVVVLTDGYVSSWGADWPCPTLWCITEKRKVSPVGRSVHIEL